MRPASYFELRGRLFFLVIYNKLIKQNEKKKPYFLNHSSWENPSPERNFPKQQDKRKLTRDLKSHR